MSKNQPLETPLENAFQRMHTIADSVWSSLAQMRFASTPARILFTSPDPRAGTTVLAAAAAFGLARNLRCEVTLIEGHLERPALGRYLDLSPARGGLAELMDGKAQLREALTELSGCPGLSVVPAGRGRPAVAGEFATDPAHKALKDLTSRGKYVILDAPSILDHPEARILLQYADAVVLVLRARQTMRADAELAQRIARDTGVEVVGTILNRFRSDLPFGFGQRRPA